MSPNGQRAAGLTGRENWGRYALGVLTEAAYILGLTLLAFLAAVLARAVF